MPLQQYCDSVTLIFSFVCMYMYNRWPPAVCAGRSSMALFTCTAKLDHGAHGARCARAMAVHHAVGISCQRNSGYRPSRVNIIAQGPSTPDPSLSPTHLSIRRGRATTSHYTHHHSIRLAWRCRTHYTSPFPGVTHWASLWGRPQRWHAKGACATPKDKDKEKKILL